MRKHLLVKMLSAAAVILLLYSCGKPQATTPAPMADDLPDDFVSFYERFHADTIFQLEHVAFPLSGNLVPGVDGGPVEDLKYERWEWIPHKNIVGNRSFQQGFSVLDSTLIFEQIQARTGAYAIERRWARLGEADWNLIWYRVNGVPE